MSNRRWRAKLWFICGPREIVISYFSHHLPWWLPCFAITSRQFLVLFTSKSIPHWQWISTYRCCWRWRVAGWGGCLGRKAVLLCTSTGHFWCFTCNGSSAWSWDKMLFHGALNAEPWKEQLVLWRDPTQHGPVSAFIINLALLTVSLKNPMPLESGDCKKISNLLSTLTLKGNKEKIKCPTLQAKVLRKGPLGPEMFKKIGVTLAWL